MQREKGRRKTLETGVGLAQPSISLECGKVTELAAGRRRDLNPGIFLGLLYANLSLATFNSRYGKLRQTPFL